MHSFIEQALTIMNVHKTYIMYVIGTYRQVGRVLFIMKLDRIPCVSAAK